MSYTIVFLSRAQYELLEAWEWYEDKQTGLGDRFKDKVMKCIHNIAQHPERYPIRKRAFRDVRIEVFPYLIIYRIDANRNIIVISSIFHTSRNPKKKYKE
ncbi:type II toxin-antitoxin system RelE/ParE family toxin [Ilyomonas limi]|uniref:Type II toxin-antitoxin system RelE/ParE family toxin n=1 Tax=Ilyomonas limi TaxID=2575867 RepID=A0A4U3KTK9_9BACT|nr:type II toxin-antitoxin system RelE/ParE family toxin [Ilyomonas limi]TKK65690.1 type II toxin-antitoxin system RelE/ParE family toxin [Ilyomonas limi]